MLPNATPIPLFDDPLDDLFHNSIVSVSGITGDLVRPRFQPEPIEHPPVTTNWVAFGISTFDADTFPSIQHDPNGNGGLGTDIVERDELITVSLSFYGPNCSQYMAQYREGIQLEQNRWDIAAAGVALVNVGQVVNLPALFKDRWVRRLDSKIIFRRRVSRTYNVPSLLGGQVSINNERLTVTVNTTTH